MLKQLDGQWYTLGDVAKVTGKNYSTLYGRVERGTLPSARHPIGKLKYYSQAEFDGLVSILKEEVR